jgi:L,D-transpeptidase ErfK/SrfK
MTMVKKGFLLPQFRPTAFCLIGVWFSSGCNFGALLDEDRTLRETTGYETSYEDTLMEVARRFHLGYIEMVAANPATDPWLPGEGTDIVLPTVHLMPDLGEVEPEGIVVNLGDMRLYYFEKAGAAPQSYPIGIGRDGLGTPVGETTIMRMTKNPIWRPTARMRKEKPELPEEVLPGPDNPLGHRAMYLGWPTYLIHGTNKPWGVGRRVSSGCVRMYPEDVEALYERVKPGTKVKVVDQAIKFGWIEDQLFMEAHPTQAQSDQLEATGHFDPLLDKSVVDRVLKIAKNDTARLDWSRIRQATLERRGYPLQITR